MIVFLKRYCDEPVNDLFLRTTSAAVQQFQQGEGQRLHTALVDHDKSVPDSSFINKFWDDMYGFSSTFSLHFLQDFLSCASHFILFCLNFKYRYFSLRCPLPINVNPFIQFAENEDKGFRRFSLVFSCYFFLFPQFLT
jgi:hypothetical protein